MKLSKRKKLIIKKYGIFGFIILGIVVLGVIFNAKFTNVQPELKIVAGAKTFSAINQPLQIQTMFEKTTNEYDSPVSTVEQRKYQGITVKAGSEIRLETEKLSGIKTSLVPPQADSIELNIWKNGKENELSILDGTIFTDNNKYKLVMTAPSEVGEYVVSLNLDYNKSKMRYTFKLIVE